MGIGERIKRIRKHYGLTQKQFGEIIGISDVAVSKLESEINKPSAQTIRLMCGEFGVREPWLREGSGAMKVPETPTDAIERISIENDIAAAIFRALAKTPAEEWKAFLELAVRIKKELDDVESQIDLNLQSNMTPGYSIEDWDEENSEDDPDDDDPDENPEVAEEDSDDKSE